MVLHPLFRSEEMTLYQMFIQYDIAYETTVNLGEAGIVEFLDLHLVGNFHRRQFAREIELCDDIERRIELMRKELQKEKMPEVEPEEDPPAPYSTELYNSELTKRSNDPRSLSLFWKIETELMATGKNVATVRRDYLKYSEYKNVMLQTETLCEGGISKTNNDSLTRMLLEDAASGVKTVGFVTGVVLTEKVLSLQRVIWRVCKGNVFFSHANIVHRMVDPDTGNEVFKSVFFAIYQGDNLEKKVMKACDGFKANVYNCPLDLDTRAAVMNDINTALNDLNEILSEASAQRKHTLEIASRNVLNWIMMIWKAKATYTTMNKFQPDKMHKVFIAEFWIPNCKLEQLNKILLSNKNDMLMHPVLMKIETDETPPTYHDLNKFTTVFQDLVDAYGANTYQEHNPAPYYIVTFPFLFSIMFGDAGHGLIMALAAFYMIANEKRFARKQPGGEIGRIFFAGRYIILLMGLFSIQSGLLYNDIFSRTTHMFDSSWHTTIKIHQLATLSNGSFFMLEPKENWDGTPYPFGLDPVWQLARNSIVFRNSLKMKMSIIFGVVHMLFGLFVGINNIFFFKTYSDILTVFIPQIIFLSFLFVYLSILIIVKWFLYGPKEPLHRQSGCAPSILNMFIGMVLFTKQEVHPGCEKDMFPYQPKIQLFLLACSLICVPWLFLVRPIVNIRSKKKSTEQERRDSSLLKCQRPSLCVDNINHPHNLQSRVTISEGTSVRFQPQSKPYYDFCQKYIHSGVQEEERKKRQSMMRFSFPDQKLEKIEQMRNSQVDRASVGYEPNAGAMQSQIHEESNFDIFIHQAIHAIEFLLGTVSNTASYLRLWALSLAHEQLSHVVWKQLFGIALTTKSPMLQPILIIIIFLFWSVLSIAILVLMEGLSAFLHTLRLHWIEFQSKFYDGNGRIFQPFNFAEILKQRLT